MTSSNKRIEPVFVEVIPNSLEQGKLYISLKYNAVLHLCACGCGNEVSTPLSPTQWKLFENGNSVSLKPSIGNWSYPCKSHYFITNNEIQWAGRWGEEKIKSARKIDEQVRKRHNTRSIQEQPKQQPSKPKKKGLWAWIFGD